MSYVIHRVELGGAQSSVSRELDSILQSSEDEYLSGDYGRILNVRAVSVLYDDPTAPVAARMNKAEPLFRKAVEFLPKAMEAWLNLGFIALARGDCNKAAEMADKSARTADPPWRTNAESFRDAMRELSRNPERCALEAERFTFGERR
jgi:tetratricopeptide (TPR) repeat protein